jgi:hypothetical protein
MVSQPLRWFDDEQSDLEAAANQAIAACGGDARETVKALIVANHFLETELEKLRASVSAGYARLPRDRKDHVRPWTSSTFHASRRCLADSIPRRFPACPHLVATAAPAA